MTDRGDFRGIFTVLADTPEFIDLGPFAQLVWFHLKLKMGPAGIDVIPAVEAVLSDTTGIPIEGVRDAIEVLSERDFLRRERNVLWLRNALKFEPSRNLGNDNHRKSIEKHLATLPKLQIVNHFAAYYDLALPFPDLMPPGYHEDGIPDHGIRSTENGVRSTEDGEQHTPPARERENPGDVENSDELAEWLGPHADLLADCPLAAESAARRSLYVQFGPPEMRANAWRRPDGSAVPPEDRPRLLAMSVVGYVGEGNHRLVPNEFAGMLRRTIRDESEPARNGSGPRDLSHWDD